MNKRLNSILNINTIKENKDLRKIKSNDKFPCYKCFNQIPQKNNCSVCKKMGFIFGSHPMVQFVEDFIQQKNQANFNQYSKKEHSFNQFDLSNSLKKSDHILNQSQHFGIGCDQCKIDPIYGNRYQCLQCDQYDLCQKCWQKIDHKHQMKLINMRNQKTKQNLKDSLAMSFSLTHSNK